MEYLSINGSKRLGGKIQIQGSKNGALPVLAAAVLIDGISVIHNCPYLTDIDAAINILKYLGCGVKREGHTVTVDSTTVNKWDIPENLMREMRSSIVFLGSVTGRTGKAKMSAPGGCEIGLRPIDMHISALEKLGIKTETATGELVCDAGAGITGTEISLPFPSVGATENIILAATLGKGTTVINNGAREPEINDLADYLNICGGDIHICSDGKIVINGVKKLHGGQHTVLPDRIAAATYLSAAAATKGDVLLTGVNPNHLKAVTSVFVDAGYTIDIKNDTMRIRGDKSAGAFREIRTMPYPGFPTDAQAVLMAAACLGKGTCIVVENIFECRFKHVPELIKMGASIKVEGRLAVVDGVERLNCARVTAPDLRGGSALAIAGLTACGITQLRGVHHIDRGYEAFEVNFASLGADIVRKYISD